MPRLGHASLVLAFFVALVCVALLALGGQRREAALVRAGRRGLLLLLALVSLASFSLFYALLTDDFSVAYVEATSRIDQPTMYKISAFWSSQEGSLLLWLWMLVIYTTLVAYLWEREAGQLLPHALAVLSFVSAFFSLIVAFIADPFRQQFPAPPDGRGMTPLLQDPGMMGHPLLLYTGFVGMTVPYAFGISTLLNRHRGTDWLRITRRWTLVAWLFLTAGIVVGGWWAYHELGWGGYWGWDPVENSSFMPWLVATAFFHSAMVEERRGLLKNWNILLIIFTFVLVVFGTFVTRSGILNSVHAFAQSPIGPWFMGFIGLVMAGSLYLVFDRYDVVAEGGSLESTWSKETSFLVNNLILVGITLVVLLGTTYPLLTRLAGQDVTVGAPYFNRVGGPLFVALLALMGVCPLLGWRRAAADRLARLAALPVALAALLAAALVILGMRKVGAVVGNGVALFALAVAVREFWSGARARARLTGESFVRGVGRLFLKNPRRYGGYAVHVGVIVMAFGIVASQFFQQVLEVPGLRVGQSFDLYGYRVTYQGLMEDVLPGNVGSVYANMNVEKGGRYVTTLKPERRFYPGYEQMGPSTEAAIMGTLTGDLYIILVGWEAAGAAATFKAWWNPGVLWIWIGFYLMIVGTLWTIAFTRAVPAGRAEAALRRLAELEVDYRSGKLDPDAYAELRGELERTAALPEPRPREAVGGTGGAGRGRESGGGGRRGRRSPAAGG